jgi:hypothetical protein
MWHLPLVQAVILGLLGSGGAASVVLGQPTPAAAGDGAPYAAGAAVGGPAPQQPAAPPPQWMPPAKKPTWLTRRKRETRKALRGAAKVGEEVLVGVGVGAGVVLGAAALLWLSSHCD